ncbi:hypothetical protein SRABI106_02427 [Rahnella aquatilis]|nr:hypothetical protein SRABI106_02427 [Rahnella aquatilis]
MQFVNQLFRVISQQNGADPPLTFGDQYIAERRFTDGKPDAYITAAGAEILRRHTQCRHGGFVKPAIRRIARRVDRLGDRRRICQFFTYPACSLRLLVLFRCHAGLCFKQAMKMICTDAHFGSQLIQRQHVG